MASNKQVDLRKIENFVRSKEKTGNFWKPCKNFKTVDETLTYKSEKMGDTWQWWETFKPQYHSILPLIQYSYTTFELQGK